MRKVCYSSVISLSSGVLSIVLSMLQCCYFQKQWCTSQFAVCAIVMLFLEVVVYFLLSCPCYSAVISRSSGLLLIVQSMLQCCYFQKQWCTSYCPVHAIGLLFLKTVVYFRVCCPYCSDVISRSSGILPIVLSMLQCCYFQKQWCPYQCAVHAMVLLFLEAVDFLFLCTCFSAGIYRSNGVLPIVLSMLVCCYFQKQWCTSYCPVHDLVLLVLGALVYFLMSCPCFSVVISRSSGVLLIVLSILQCCY